MIRARDAWWVGILLWTLLLPLPESGARRVPITILHTTDVHGHMFPITDYEGNANVGGYLRCATLIERMREEARNVLLIDCGDTIQGSVETWLTDGHVARKALEWMQYDAWVLGNHEFDWGVEALVPIHDRTSLPILGANVGVAPDRRHPLPKVRSFLVKRLDGVKIVIVGLNTPGIPSWIRPEYLGAVRFEDSLRALARVMPRVRTLEPDVLVLAAHQGYRPFGDDFANQINAIASRYPEFDVILGGHTHQELRGVDVNGVLYNQPGYHGNWLGRVELVYDTVEKRVVERTADVLLVGDRYPAHAGLKAHLEAELAEAKAYEAEVIGHTDYALSASLRLPGQSPVQQLIARAIRERVACDVVLHGVLGDAEIPPGPITRKDVWRVVPYENTIGVAHLTVQELQSILEENIAHAHGIRFLGVYGLEYELWRNARPGARVRNVRLPEGAVPHPRKRLRVAMNSYVLASGGRRFMQLRKIVERPTSRLEMTGVDTRSAVMEYVRTHSPLQIAPGTEVALRRGASARDEGGAARASGE